MTACFALRKSVSARLQSPEPILLAQKGVRHRAPFSLLVTLSNCAAQGPSQPPIRHRAKPHSHLVRQQRTD